MISARAEDANVRRAYEQHAACFVNKALDASSLEKIVRSVGGFWLTIVRLSPVPTRSAMDDRHKHEELRRTARDRLARFALP
ncbi:MAG: hypothetical protein H6713_39020 [Myxococcales bacterium]|nr:hypothetical protein [Myxococcales bacterium]